MKSPLIKVALLSFAAVILSFASLSFSSYFKASIIAQKSITEKDLEGIWKPVKFLQFDYEIFGQKEVSIADFPKGAGIKNYLYFKGNKLCREGIEDGADKKPCSDTKDPKFREFLAQTTADGGITINVWADDEQTYTFPLELKIVSGQLVSILGDGSEEYYEKVKSKSSSSKESKKSKKSKKSSKKSKKSEKSSKKSSKDDQSTEIKSGGRSSLDGAWAVLEAYSMDSSGKKQNITPIIWSIAFNGKKMCTDWNRDKTKCYYDSYTEQGGKIGTSKMFANGQSITIRSDGKLEMQETQKGTNYYIFSKLNKPIPEGLTLDEWLEGI